MLEEFHSVLPEQSLNLETTLSSLSSSPEKKATCATQGPASTKSKFESFWSSPENDVRKDVNERKRKHPPAMLDSSQRALFDDEGEGACSTAMHRLKFKQKAFSRSMSSWTSASMPVSSSGTFFDTPDWLAPTIPNSIRCTCPMATCLPCKARQKKSRRASLPYNLKIPQIAIMPSSISPDPNHPVCAEFFEDRLYLETKQKQLTYCSSKDSGGVQRHQEEEKNNIPSPENIVDVNKAKDGDSSLSLNLNEDDMDSSLEICYEKIANSPNRNKDIARALDEQDSTPELEEILEKAMNDTERSNCQKFINGLAKGENHDPRTQQDF